MQQPQLNILSVERLLEGVEGLGIAVAPPEKLTVMLGEVVRVLLQVEYRGPELTGEIHVSYGRQNLWFNEDGNKQADIVANFPQSIDWRLVGFACNIPIGGSFGTGYDLYAKIEAVPGPDIFTDTYLDVLDVLGAAEFRNFEITDYSQL